MSSARILQIKYGECELYDLHPGDSVRWATGNREVLNHGTEPSGKAWIPAYSGACPICGDESWFADFAVGVDGSQLVGAVQAPLGYRFAEDSEVVRIAVVEDPTPELLPR